MFQNRLISQFILFAVLDSVSLNIPEQHGAEVIDHEVFVVSLRENRHENLPDDQFSEEELVSVLERDEAAELLNCLDDSKVITKGFWLIKVESVFLLRVLLGPNILSKHHVVL